MKEFIAMNNSDTGAAWSYHNGTKHPHGNLMDPFHFFDPSEQPLLYKVYKNVKALALPLDKSPVGVPTLEAISSSRLPSEERVPDLRTVARILYFSAGMTKRIRYPFWGELEFRAASCTGALYHIELYVVCSDLPDLGAGVYHFDPRGFSLEQLRKGDYRKALIEASGEEPSIAGAPVIIIYTDIFWRNACKYQAREYRHAFWDSGTIISHTLALCSAHGMPARLILGFVDSNVNELLGLDTMKEVALSMVSVGHGSKEAPPFSGMDQLSLGSVPTSLQEKDFPAIRGFHEASSFRDEKEAMQWRGEKFSLQMPEPKGKLFDLKWATKEEAQDPIEDVVIRRGSTRRFSPESITFAQLSTILHYSTGGLDSDFLETRGSLNNIYLILNAVDGLPAGAYVVHTNKQSLELLKEGDFRYAAGHLGLGQALPNDASVNAFFLTDLGPVLETFGNRGYRAAQLEASIVAGKMYLAAYAQGIGATGLTFYDDEVTGFFSPHAKGKSAMFLLAVGKPAKKTSSSG